MRKILNLSIFMLMWLSLITASSSNLDTVECVLNLDLKLVCDGEHIECVCNHGDEISTGFYKLKLDFSALNKEGALLESLADKLILPLVEQLQHVNILDPHSNYVCSSIRLLKQDPTHKEGFSSDEECETLLHCSLSDLHNKFDPEKSLVLEVNLYQGASF